MAKKNDAFYYDSFAKAAELACKAAEKLDDVMRHFDPAKIEDAVAEMHEIEQSADEIVHEVNDALISAFITPIEREDISTLANALDVVTDRIEGVLHRIYFTNIQEMRPDALMMSAKVMRACEQMHDLVLELPSSSAPRACASTSSPSTPSRANATTCSSTPCARCTPPTSTLWPSSPGATSTCSLSSLQIPASSSPTRSSPSS